ncbi:hypothetical protein AB0C81_35495 [Streptomyces roseoverticillatus]|uniref:hypothetical protein n=1 Tax=Streptomyces roseoverticillatus TaxID=66429 RepID=UPI0033DF2810
MTTYLGPIEHAHGRWVIGDAERASGRHLELTAEGVLTHGPGDEEGQLVPWSRFMSLSLHVTTVRWASSRTAGLLNDFFGDGIGPMNSVDSNGSCLQGTVRKPYEHWAGRFSHHDHRYSYAHVMMAQELVRQLMAAQAVERLGDAEWLAGVIARLTDERPRTFRAAQLLVASVLGLEDGDGGQTDRSYGLLGIPGF